MYIFKNAWISIIRNKTRNILMGIIILVVACACTITLAINNTAKDLIKSYKNAYTKELSITFNREKMMKDVDFSNKENIDNAKDKFNDIKSYSLEDITKFAKNKHIKSYYYTYEISLNGKNIEKVEETNDDNNPGNKPKDLNKDNQSNLDFTLTGYSNIDAMSEFIEGKYKMSKILDNAWDIAFDGDYVFINEELASYNNLSLNDTITLKDEDENTYEFKIIGIFKETSDDDQEKSMFSNSSNTIITNAESLVKISNKNENIKEKINPTFIIDSYKNADKIEKYFYNKGLDETYSVKTNEEEVNSGIDAINNVKSFATTFLIITLVIGGIVLFVLNMINIRERKYEIGVLRTIGISKLKLTLQFISELIIISSIALLLGATTGATMSKSISNSLLSNEIENSKNNKEEIRNNFVGENKEKFNDKKQFDHSRNTPTVSAYKKIDAVVNAKVILELFGIGLILVLISSSAAMISIQRFSPLTILKERS